MASSLITVRPADLLALAERIRAVGGALADVERITGDGTAASGDPTVGLALSTFDDSWDANRAVLVGDLELGAGALESIATVFTEQDDVLAEILDRAGRGAPAGVGSGGNAGGKGGDRANGG